MLSSHLGLPPGRHGNVGRWLVLCVSFHVWPVPSRISTRGTGQGLTLGRCPSGGSYYQ